MNSVLHVVQLSGGKDSQAAAKLIRETYPNEKIIGLFCDTKFEHPMTYAHVKKISSLYNLDLITLNNGDVLSQCVKWGRFPGGGSRHCTDYLKIQPAKKWLIEKATTGVKVINYLGVRSDESPERSKRYGRLDNSLYMPHEVMPSKYPKYMGQKLGIRFNLPILDWTKADVFDYLDGEHNPLYDLGFDRVGCFPCLAGGDKAKVKAFKFDATGTTHYALCRSVARHIRKPLLTSKIGNKLASERCGDGCAFCAM